MSDDPVRLPPAFFMLSLDAKQRLRSHSLSQKILQPNVSTNAPETNESQPRNENQNQTTVTSKLPPPPRHLVQKRSASVFVPTTHDINAQPSNLKVSNAIENPRPISPYRSMPTIVPSQPLVPPPVSDSDKRFSLPVHFVDARNSQLLNMKPSIHIPQSSLDSMGQRQSALNFVNEIMSKINELRTNCPPKIVDENGFITEYESKQTIVRCIGDPNAYNVARKCDLLNYGDLLLKITQRLLLESMNELETHEKSDYQNILVKHKIVHNVGQKSLDEMRKIHVAFRKVVCYPYNTKITIGCTDVNHQMNMTLDAEAIKKGKFLVQAYRRQLLSIVNRVQCELAHILMESYLPTKSELTSMNNITDRLEIRHKQLEAMASKCSFYKYPSLSDLNSVGFAVAAAHELSSQHRKVCIQELMFTQYGNVTHGTTTTHSQSVQIPINSYFDPLIYTNRYTCRSTKDRSRPGLVNPYKSSYIKNGRVVWETIRTGSLPAIQITDMKERKKVTSVNAKEFITTLAINHLKRFTRTEIESMSRNGQPIDIPFTSLSLLTPFFLSGNEDIQTIEHHEAILAAVNDRDVDSVTCQLSDGAPITVRVTFQPCLLNIGVNVVMKTLMFGAGLQRAINCRGVGLRLFQHKVSNCLQEINAAKKLLRNEIVSIVETLFTSNSSREMAYYRNTVMSELNRVLQSQILLEEFIAKRAHDRQTCNYQYFLLQRERELEKKINSCWDTDNSASIEISTTREIRPIINEIHEFLEKIYRAECSDWNTRYNTLISWEQQFVSNLIMLVSKTNNQVGLQLIQGQTFEQYRRLMNKERDIVHLYSDFEQMYFDGIHEKFSQGLIESNDVNDVYSIPVRIMMLSFLLGEQSHFNCKSGKDRTGELQDQCQEFAEMREQCQAYPRAVSEKSEYNDHRRHVHTMLAMNGGSLEIIKQNLGIIGSKMDTCISGRFLPGFYKRYKGLSSLDTVGIGSSDRWTMYDEIAKSVQ
jgi:hypothetical protein